MQEEMNVDVEFLEEIPDPEIRDMIPKLNVDNKIINPDEQKSIISDEMLLGMYEETLSIIKKDREEATVLYEKLSEMVFNEGDSSSSTKEAMVNLFKIKTDSADKMSKIADLATRLKLKDTFPKYLAAHQNNTINIGKRSLTSEEKRKIIEHESKKVEGK